jgi:glucose/arabinose dehydrogenase
MPRIRPLLALLPLCAALAACGSDTGAPGPAQTATGDAPAQESSDAPTVQELATGLEVPWDVAFLPDGRALVTERPGRVRLVDADGSVQQAPVARVPTDAEGESGLLGIALDPGFEDGSPFAYVMVTTGPTTQLQRWRWAEDSLTRDGIVLDGIAAAPNHDAGTLRFGPDGHLYVPTGDAGKKERAQDRGSRNGKLLRLTPEQYRSRAEEPEVRALGLRNTQGLAWQPGTGRLFATDHGPSGWDGPGGDDEVNLLRPGGNYGWPLVQGTATGDGLTPPAWLWESAVAPSGAAFSTKAGTAWTGDLLVATLRGSALRRLDVDGAAIRTEEKVLEGRGRLRAVVEAPDGSLWVTTSNRDGYGEPLDGGDDRILRIVPPAA